MMGTRGRSATRARTAWSTPPRDPDFETVLAAAREGQEWAWARIYDDIAPVLLGYLIAQNAPHPEDVASEVFLQVVRDLGSFGGSEEKFRSWVFTIATHRLMDARRYARRRPSTAVEHDHLDRLLPTEQIEHEVLEKVTTEELTLLLEVLTEDQRNVLLLRVVAGLSLPEVAEVLGKKYESVRALQKRALASLRKELDTNPYPFRGEMALTPST